MAQGNTEVIEIVTKLVDNFLAIHGSKAIIENQDPKVRSVLVVFKQMQAAFASEETFDEYLQLKFLDAIDKFNRITVNETSFPDKKLFHDASVCIHDILVNLRNHDPLKLFIMEHGHKINAGREVHQSVSFVINALIIISKQREDQDFITGKLDSTIKALRRILHGKDFPLQSEYELRQAAFQIINSIDSSSSTSSTPPTLLFRQRSIEIPFDLQYDSRQRLRPVARIQPSAVPPFVLSKDTSEPCCAGPGCILM